jgi:hypothetical protein
MVVARDKFEDCFKIKRLDVDKFGKTEEENDINHITGIGN